MRIFDTADILIPAPGVDGTRWSCVACDQFTSQPEYWARAEALVGDAPSTLRLMLPEAYLGRCDEAAETEKIGAAMEAYLRDGVFREVPDSFVYVERTLPSGAVRRGLVGALDLEAYDWAEGTHTPIRATEGTVESRLPPRVKVRLAAALEMPHILVFINDPADAVIPSADGGELLYDFDLMLSGGHVCGRRVTGEAAARTAAAVEALPGPIRFAMGDGNHSLAAAKRCWETVRAGLPESARETHPARRALVELVNLHDPAITFEPIHRVLFDTNAAPFLDAAAQAFPSGGTGHRMIFLAGDRTRSVTVPDLPLGGLIGAAEAFCQSYLARYGGRVDYIHGGAEARALAARPGCCGVLLPRMEKDELFSSVERGGPFPKKSFSIGEGPDKRYYLECRRIR